MGRLSFSKNLLGSIYGEALSNYGWRIWNTVYAKKRWAYYATHPDGWERCEKIPKRLTLSDYWIYGFG
jgi:hypothetical protein